MNTCYNCIWFQEQVCMHKESNKYYWDGAEDTNFAEECSGFDDDKTNFVDWREEENSSNKRIDDWVEMSLASL